METEWWGHHRSVFDHGTYPQVADNHYLKINDEIKTESAVFIGEAFPINFVAPPLHRPHQAVAKTVFMAVWRLWMASIIVLSSFTVLLVLAMQL